MSCDIRAMWELVGGKTPAHWSFTTLEKLLETPKSVSVGVMYPGADTKGGVPLIRVSDVKNGALVGKPDFCISAEVDEEYKRTRLNGTELLITLVGNPGDCILVTEEMKDWNAARALAVVRLKNLELREWLRYVLLSKPAKHIIDARLNTTVQKTLNLKDVKELPIPLPPESERDLITKNIRDIEKKRVLNSQTNQTLEQMAQAIFKSWFVDFDPVKAKINGEQPVGMDAATASLFPEKLVESELGLVPDGWPVGKLSELIKFANGKSGKKSDSGQFPLYGANGIIGFSEEAKFEDAVIIGRVGAYCGAIEYCNSQFWASDNTIVATAKSGKAQLPFVLYLLKHLDLNQHAGGAAQPLLNQKVLNSLEIPIPTDAVLERYSELLSTMLDKMTHNIEENHNLESLRDTLLPKLLSGEIELGAVKPEV